MTIILKVGFPPKGNVADMKGPPDLWLLHPIPEVHGGRSVLILYKMYQYLKEILKISFKKYIFSLFHGLMI
jgi:hypothetical protein